MKRLPLFFALVLIIAGGVRYVTRNTNTNTTLIEPGATIPPSFSGNTVLTGEKEEGVEPLSGAMSDTGTGGGNDDTELPLDDTQDTESIPQNTITSDAEVDEIVNLLEDLIAESEGN